MIGSRFSNIVVIFFSNKSLSFLSITLLISLKSSDWLINITVPSSLVHPDNFVLQVRGQSMIDEQIQDGDYIVVKKTASARSGQIVVAIINDEATLKCYVPKSNHVELHPRNPEFPVITIKETDKFYINGVLLYSFREYPS